MKITPDQLHPELRPLPFVAKAYTRLLSRKFGFRLLNKILKRKEGKNAKGLVNQQLFIASNNGPHKIRVRVYRQEDNSNKLPVMLYLHGGGYALGNPERTVDLYKAFMEKRPCVVVAPGYRNSQEQPFPAAFDDCYDTLLWIRDNADTLNGDPNNIMVVGHSAGGGLTAALALKARDTKDVAINFQMPIYPMIDDRQQTESSQFESPIWGKHANQIGWEWYLKAVHERGEDIPTYAAPARSDNFQGLPPTVTFIGGIDPFRDETIAYVKGLEQANISVKFQLFGGCYHAFELLLPKTQVSKDAMKFLYDSYAEFYDTYVKPL